MPRRRSSPVRAPQAPFGQKNEGGLHRMLKAHYAAAWSGSISAMECPMEGYIVDIVTPDTLIEIQTGHFSAIKGKLEALLPVHPLLLVYPLPVAVRIDYADMETGLVTQGRWRRQPEGLTRAFAELVYIAPYLLDPHLTIEIALVRTREIRVRDGKGSRHRGGVSIRERELEDIVDTVVLAQGADYLGLLPEAAPLPGTRADMARALGLRPQRVDQVCYVFEKMGLWARVGKRGNALIYDTAHPKGCESPDTAAPEVISGPADAER